MRAAAARTLAAPLMLLALLAGCDRPAVLAREPSAPAMAKAQERAGDGRRATLATTRRVDMEVAPDGVAPLFASTQAACEADAASACVVLASRLDTGDYAHAELTLRAAPAGIARLLAKLHSGHGLVGESASSEDLAAPIVDSERQIAMAREYRESLLALRAKGGNDIKAMMSINEELARVQSQLESATGERAHLQRRIDTETLTVVIASTGARESHPWRTIASAFGEFGAHLADATGAAITFVAYAIPWAIVLLPLAWGARWLWRRRRAAR
ncbi:MAG TPA: DUF4349 domain-containing protein [Burkholderiaceae bacterium]